MTDHQARALRTMNQTHRRPNDEQEAYLRQLAERMARSENVGDRVIGAAISLRMTGDSTLPGLAEFLQSLRDAIARFDTEWVRYNRR